MPESLEGMAPLASRLRLWNHS